MRGIARSRGIPAGYSRIFPTLRREEFAAIEGITSKTPYEGSLK